MELFCYEDHRPIWISFENPTGEPGGGGKENFGAKGHPFEFVAPGEEKVLCDVEGPGVIRRISRWKTAVQRCWKEFTSMGIGMGRKSLRCVLLLGISFVWDTGG